MSIKSFIDSAEILYKHEKYNESLCLVCIAIDAYSAQLYPKRTVSQRYKLFLKEHFKTISLYGFPGISTSGICIKTDILINNLKSVDGYVSMEDIIYHVIRCGLVHQCDIDDKFVFVENTSIGNFKSGKFHIPKTIIHGLVRALCEELPKENLNI